MSRDNPFGEPEAVTIKCPVCKKADFDAFQNQYESWRVCRKCGNRWSGGIGVKQPDFTKDANRALVPPPGVPAPDDDIPEYRDLGKNFGWEGDDW